MSTRDTSGPAFPIQGSTLSSMTGETVVHQPADIGLSKREYYAGEAMKVLLANALLECDPGKRGDAILESVESSFFVADLMVKEAEK